MIANYNTENIRKLLKSGFTYEELHNNLCFDKTEFRSVLGQIPCLASINDIVQAILEHAERWNLMRDLLEWAEKKNPVQYKECGPYYSEEAKEKAKMGRQEIEDRKKFFKIDESNPKITIYLSRHLAITQLPTINISLDEANSPMLKAIYNYQEFERQSFKNQPPPDKFAAVSAVEMLETLYLKDEIEKSYLRAWYPEDIQKELLKTSIIEVDIRICPEPGEYGKILDEGTVIFIGGPRANLGTYLYLYGAEAGKLRPTRLPKDIYREGTQGERSNWPTKDIIESINSPKTWLTCDEGCNLAIVQKYTIDKNGNTIDKDGKTIFYLAGTGANGTAAAVAYLRRHWRDLYENEDYRDKDFCVVINVTGRAGRETDLIGYGPDSWTDKEWARVGGNTLILP